MKRQTMVEAGALVLLVSAGVALRLWFRDLPNFAPVAALALFSGYYFRSQPVALCVPLGVMIASDYVLGGYEPLLMGAVYGALALPVVMRGIVRRSLERNTSRRWGRLAGAVACVVGCSLTASVVFFGTTNFVVWLGSGIYPHSLRGLAACYWQAVPFFRYTVAGDAVFSGVLFGGYALARALATSPGALRPAWVVAASPTGTRC